MAGRQRGPWASGHPWRLLLPCGRFLCLLETSLSFRSLLFLVLCFCVHVCENTCMHRHVCVFVDTCMCTYRRVCACVCTCVRACVERQEERGSWRRGRTPLRLPLAVFRASPPQPCLLRGLPQSCHGTLVTSACPQPQHCAYITCCFSGAQLRKWSCQQAEPRAAPALSCLHSPTALPRPSQGPRTCTTVPAIRLRSPCASSRRPVPSSQVLTPLPLLLQPPRSGTLQGLRCNTPTPVTSSARPSASRFSERPGLPYASPGGNAEQWVTLPQAPGTGHLPGYLDS